MSSYVQGPCPKCNSSDAYTEYEDGHSHCYSCGYHILSMEKDKEAGRLGLSGERRQRDLVEHTLQYVAWRGVSADTMRHYGVKTKVSPEGKPLELGFRWPNGRTLWRKQDAKEFYFTGEKIEEGELFGMDRFPAGSAKAVTITEGALDALSAFQIHGSKYPVVAVTSASSAKTECGKEFEYLNSFEKIYLSFDSDEPGQKAAAEVARLFDFNKVYLIDLSRKDANEYLTNNDQGTYIKEWWAARKFLPEGILSTYAEFDKVIDDEHEKPSVPYPYPRLQQMTYGIRTGEFILLTAQEGIGKTEIIRSFEYHLLKTTKENLGIIHLEESKARALKGLVGYELKRPVHLPDYAVSKDELKSVLRSVTGSDERLHLYSHFGSDDPDVILSTIRFMAGACSCKYIFLDHITMVVSGSQGDDERRQLDYISTRLAMMVEELDFTLFCISHVNDEGKTRGSRNISKVADLRIDLHRNISAELEEERNTTYLNITKNRFSGKTGPAGSLVFDPSTFVLSEGVDANAL